MNETIAEPETVRICPLGSVVKWDGCANSAWKTLPHSRGLQNYSSP